MIRVFAVASISEDAGMDLEETKRGAIKVLLVDDSPVALLILKRMLLSAPDITISGTAGNGKEALHLIPQLHPDVICTDLHMPVMGGLEFTREVMERYPKPILVVSVSVAEGSDNVFRLIEAGALDVFQKPRTGAEEDYIRQKDEFIAKIRILAGVRVFRRIKKEAPIKMAEPPIVSAKVRMVAIGGSTGGPQAFGAILSRLPADFTAPVICVQHIGEGFLDGFVEWLRELSAMRVEIAKEGGVPEAGVIYLPRSNFHLLLSDAGRFEYSGAAPLNGHRPSITVTFRSVAERYGSAAMGVLLTGMGDDGAEGMRSIVRAGGVTIAQDEGTSVVFSMPKHAIELDAAGSILPLEGIAPAIIARVASNGGKGARNG